MGLLDEATAASLGIPANVWRYMMTGPSVNDSSPGGGGWQWPSNYRGWQQDAGAYNRAWVQGQGANYQPLQDAMAAAAARKAANLPMAEGSMAPDTSSLWPMPNGQWVPQGFNPQNALNYWRQQGNPSSFYWNPQLPPGLLSQ